MRRAARDYPGGPEQTNTDQDDSELQSQQEGNDEDAQTIAIATSKQRRPSHANVMKLVGEEGFEPSRSNGPRNFKSRASALPPLTQVCRERAAILALLMRSVNGL